MKLFAALFAVLCTLVLGACAGGSSSDGSDGGNGRLTGDARRAYYDTAGYQAKQPFGYDEPIIDGFYDSSYEESIYSPFSFN